MCIPLSLLCVFLYLYFVYCSISICTSCFNLHSKVQPFTLIVFLLYCKYSFFLARHCINNDSFSFYIDGSDQHLYWKYNFFLVRHCINNDSYSFYIDGSVQQMYPKVQSLPCRALHQLMQPPLVLVIWSTDAKLQSTGASVQLKSYHMSSVDYLIFVVYWRSSVPYIKWMFVVSE